MASTTSPKNQDKVYADFDTNLNFHPIRKDVALLTNEDAVKRSIRNIVLTNYYERNDPTVGANIGYQLFELASRKSQIIIENSLTTAIKNHEPRANLISVNVAMDPDEHSISATITFSVISNAQPVSLTVILERVR
jgi:phage baseplate assembly protein W